MSEMRKTFDTVTKSFLVEKYVKSRKIWKPLQEDLNEVSQTGIRKKMYLGNHYYANDALKYTWSGAEELYLEYLMSTRPNLKYRIKKLSEVNDLNWARIAKLVEFEDIPETETIMLKPIRQYYVGNRIMLDILGYKWKHEKNRKQLVKKILESDTSEWTSYEDITRDNFMYDRIEGYDFSSVYRRDAEKLGIIKDRNACRRYSDYLAMIHGAGHDVNDPYWRYKKNWEEEHNKYVELQNTFNRLNDLRSFLGMPRLQSINEGDLRLFKNLYEPFKDKVLERGNLRVFLSDDINNWAERARKLHQCIVSAKYYLKKNSRCLFVDRDGEPSTTFEIGKNNQIIQMHGDEHGDDIVPKEDIDAVKAFVDMYSLASIGG